MSDKKRVLVLQHIHENPAGRVGAILDEYETFYHLIHVGKDHLPDPTRYDAIVVLGGAAYLYDAHRYSYCIHEEAYLHQAIKQSVLYLGMCLGTTACESVSSRSEEIAEISYRLFRDPFFSY